ncbi:MAG: hypothetical protein Fur009_8170 [Candidatus Microgenomates bacterium]
MFFNKKSKQKDNHYLGIFLKEQKGVLIFISSDSSGLKIIDKLTFNFTNGWENLIEDIDENLFKLEETHKITFSKTIFFLYSHLIDDITKNIKAPYLKKIKDLVKNLDLEPLGYIECFEAVSSFLEKKEQNPLNAIILETDKNQLGVFIYQGGRLIYKNTIAKTDYIVDDFIAAVAHLKDKNIFLPSRIIIYDSDDLNKEVDDFLNYRWDKNYFIQFPKIEILKEDEVIDGLVEIFSKQIDLDKDIQQEAENEFGFVLGKDVEMENKSSERKKISFNFSKIIEVFKKLSLPKFTANLTLPNFGGNFLIIIGLLTILTGLFINEYFYHKASLTIYLPTQTIEKNIKTSIDYQIATSEAEFSETIATSGKKDIGDKAKGTVTIYNFDDKEMLFSKGTILEASNIKFLLDDDVKVASSTFTADASAKLPGKKEVGITAYNIGEEANLGKGTRFKIDDLSTNLYFAINDKSLSGGSKRQIKTVSPSDITTLETKVLAKAKTQQLNIKNTQDLVILKDLTDYEIVDKRFSKELGDETDSITLNAKVRISYYLYKKNTLESYLIEDLKDGLKANFVLEKNNIKYKVLEIKKNDNKLDLSLQVKAKAIVNFDKNKALGLIVGKNKNQLNSILKTDFKVQGYNLIINKNLPLIEDYLPFFKKNIDLKISGL